MKNENDQIKLTSIDASQLASGQVIHIPTAQANAQNNMQPITITGAQGQQLTLIPASAINLAQQGNLMRGMNLGGGVMQLQPGTGLNTANGFLQSIPVQNIPGIGNVQVIPATALQPSAVQTLPTGGASAASPIVATATPNNTTLHFESVDQPKWQILQTIQPNGAITTTSPATQPQQPQHQMNVQQNVVSVEPDPKQHRRRIPCTCPNCGDGDR